MYQPHFTKYSPHDVPNTSLHMLFFLRQILSFMQVQSRCNQNSQAAKQFVGCLCCCARDLDGSTASEAMLPCCPVARGVYDVVELALRHGCRIGSVGRLFLLLVACFLKGGASLNGTRDEDLETCDPNPW